MKYTIKYGFIISCLLLLASCQQSDLLEEVHNASASSRATQTYSYFKNVKKTISDSGEVYIRGEIHCTEETEYTFIFSYQGSAGASYEARIGYNNHLFPANGSSFREITTKFEPGIHICDLQIYFTGPSQQADARIVIRKINGIESPIGEGSGDLVAQGESKLAQIGGGESMHWTCPYCHFTLNGIGSNTCIACGKP